MKTKKQLFKAATKGPDIQYNTLLQILEAVIDQRNITIACIMEEEEDITAVKAEMKRIYQEEMAELEREKIYAEQVKQIAKARVEQKKVEDKNG